MDKLTILFLTLLIWLQYSLWFGKNGLHDYNRVKNEIFEQKETNEKIKTRNNQLFSKINDLRKQEAIEEYARNQLGMTKLGEIFYRLIPSVSKCD